MNDPLLELIRSATELMNHSFAPPGDAASARLELYHQFRKLWDRGIPVGMGLGHLIMKAEDQGLRIERIAEKGAPGAILARILFGTDASAASRKTEPSVACIVIDHDQTRWTIRE